MSWPSALGTQSRWPLIRSGPRPSLPPGTVTNIREAVRWLSYTYMAIRMHKNPLHYALTLAELAADPALESHKRALVTEAAKQLKACQMAVFDDKSGNLYVTELGRVASHFYVKHQSMTTFNAAMRPLMGDAALLAMIASSDEFESMMIREDELPELEKLQREACPVEAKGGVENCHGKVNILIQAFVSRARVDSFSLTADMMYAAQNAPRIARAVFEIALRRKWAGLAESALTLCVELERRLWAHEHPLRQFEGVLCATWALGLWDPSPNI